RRAAEQAHRPPQRAGHQVGDPVAEPGRTGRPRRGGIGRKERRIAAKQLNLKGIARKGVTQAEAEYEMPDLTRLVEDLSALTVIEGAELAKMLEEKWGVSAAA